MTNLSKPNTSASNSNKRGYVYGFVQPTSPDFAQYPSLVGPTVASFGGKMLYRQHVKEAIYTESVDDFSVCFVLQFPSLQMALNWYASKEYSDLKALRLSTSKGPMVIVEGDDFDDCTGFLAAFIKVNDKGAFEKYSPVDSLEKYGAKRIYVKLDEAPLSETDDYDAAVLIAFPSVFDAKEWMFSDEYKPERELRLSTTSGPCAVIGDH